MIDDLEDRVVELEKIMAVHDGVCTERYGKLLDGLRDLKKAVEFQAVGLAGVVTKLTESAGSGRTIREVIAWGLAALGALATLYSGLPFQGRGLGH